MSEKESKRETSVRERESLERNGKVGFAAVARGLYERELANFFLRAPRVI